MYQNLVRSVDANAPESIHHCAYPTADEATIDHELLNDVAISRAAVALGHSIRASSNVKVRQPLGKAIVVVTHDQRDSVERTKDIIADELNVKSVELAENEAEFVTYRAVARQQETRPEVRTEIPASSRGAAKRGWVRGGAGSPIGTKCNAWANSLSRRTKSSSHRSRAKASPSHRKAA